MTLLRLKKFEPLVVPSKHDKKEEVEKMNKSDQERIGLSILRSKLTQKEKDIKIENLNFEGRVTKESLALQILGTLFSSYISGSGYAQSYIDFFCITQNRIPEIVPGFHEEADEIFLDENINRSIDFKEAELLDFKKRLIVAEENFRYEDKVPSMQEYLDLAEKFFEELTNFQAAAYFYKRCYQISKLTSEIEFRFKSRLGFGKCHDKLGRTEEAVDIFEELLNEAETAENEDIVVQTARELIDIYHKIALTFEEESNYSINEALEYYERCLSVAQMASEKEAEGSICNKIGTLYFNMGEIGKSIDYQKRYLEIAKEYNNDAGRQKQMESYSGLAKAFLKIEKIEEAQEYLELFYSIAKELRMNNAQSEAALLLANLNSKKKNTSKSLEFYQLHFDAARTEKPENKSRKLIDKARVTLGIAKSNSNIGNFLKWIEKSNDNMKPLLDWKSKREK